MSNNELHALIKELKEFKLLKEEAEARISELEGELKAEMTAQGKDKITVDEYKATLSTVTQQRIDSKRLESEQPTIYTMYLKPSVYTRLTVR
jgi:predicted phage-related endonuclease